MKKLMFMALSAVILSGCGGNKAEKADSDSIAEAEIMEAVAAVRNASYITNEGVGPVHIGLPMTEVADSVPGLYNHKENGASPDAVTITFSDADGEQFVAYDFGEGKVDVINVIGNALAVSAPNGDFGIGAPFSKVLELPGVQAEWTGYDDGGMWYWTWHGLWFAPSQENLPENLSKRLYLSEEEPVATDFNDNVTVGFIGTGLPF